MNSDIKQAMYEKKGKLSEKKSSLATLKHSGKLQILQWTIILFVSTQEKAPKEQIVMM